MEGKTAPQAVPRRKWYVWPLAALLLLAPVWVVPRLWCGREADAWFDGKLAAQDALAREVARWVERGVTKDDFSTGNALVNGEWRFGTYQMAVLGLAQIVREHPERAAEYVPAMEKCIEEMLSPAVSKFDTRSWGEAALDTLDGPHGHVAYLGYMNLSMSFYRAVAPQPRFTDLSDRITAALARRYSNSPTGILETYPGWSFPIDNMAAVASIALYDKATGADHSALLARWVRTCRASYVDRDSGLLIQAVDADNGEPVDKPRASGTALGAYFMSFADMDFSRDLHESLVKACGTDWAGFGLVREYPPNVEQGRGDVDSGPVLLGMSFSGTGFHIAGARIHGDRGRYRELYRTAYIIGAPLGFSGRRSFACGGPLGNAIMLAMLTAGGGK